jgi:hypothetical protein
MNTRQLYRTISLLFLFLAASCLCITAQTLQLSQNGKSDYKIYIPQNASRTEIKAAAVLKDYFNRVTGVFLPIVNEKTQLSTGFFIGSSGLSKINKEINTLPNESFIIRTA